MNNPANGRFVEKCKPGLVVGRATLIEKIGKRGHNNIWRCVCTCGRTFDAFGPNILRGNTRSCGCLRVDVAKTNATTHGLSAKSIYFLWQNMMRRCYQKSLKAYPNYGGRGIEVCERWHSVENFVADMGYKPLGLTLERKDNDGPYSPENCIWATPKEQTRNTRSNALATINGVTKSIVEWSESSGIPAGRIYCRRYMGWPDAELLLEKWPRRSQSALAGG